MVIRHNKMPSGETYTVYMVVMDRVKLGQKTWRVLCGCTRKKPAWVPLRITQHGQPYFWFNNTKLFLDDFKVA